MNEYPQVDRRQSDRFPIAREVRYRILDKRTAGESGKGNTLNMSSSGVLFAVEGAVPPGSRVELSINWPVKLNDKCALSLVTRGRIVRAGRGTAAIEILEHEFRTKSSSSQATYVAS